MRLNIGNYTTITFDLPIPGSVIGLVLLFLGLRIGIVKIKMIINKLNENDFSGLVEAEEEVTMFFQCFPVFIQKNDVIFRLYKHKIEVDLLNEMRDRYIYMFSNGRLTSGLFQCFKLYDKEYV